MNLTTFSKDTSQIIPQSLIARLVATGSQPNSISLPISIGDRPPVNPMLAEPERAFSGARRSISWDRFRLGHDNIERLECMKSRIRTGIASTWREEVVERQQHEHSDTSG